MADFVAMHRGRSSARFALFATGTTGAPGDGALPGALRDAPEERPARRRPADRRDDRGGTDRCPVLLRRPALAASARRRREGADAPRARLRHPDGAEPRDGRAADRELRCKRRSRTRAASRAASAARSSGSSGQGCFGILPAHVGPHRRPGAAPEARQVAGDLDRPLGRREQVQDQRHAPAGDRRMLVEPEQLLHPHGEDRALPRAP